MNEGLIRLDAQLAAGRPAELREALLALSSDERAVLEEELGPETFDRVYATARKRARQKLGRVVLINGIMGASLDVLKGGDRDRVWIHYWRLMQGRIADLGLRADGVSPTRPGVRVEVAGLHRKTYLAMALELDTHWDCLQFAFDWRLDIRASARKLLEAIESWGAGAPVHLVAHSMGGLVSRSFVRQFPEQWKRMADDGLRAGGRLVMLGTPNHGSYAIPLMLSGEEKILRQLALLDGSHKLPALLSIIGTFPGGFQMLPSPHVATDDDHARLYDSRVWGRFPVTPPLLASAAKFHDELRQVLTPERSIYVAGYDQETVHRVRIDAPGRFKYQTTRAGDGRVPHELGLLPNVATRWVREVHGDLPRNRDVLDGIHELLSTGDTPLLESSAPARARGADELRWRPAEEFEMAPGELEEFERLVEKVRATQRRRGPKKPPVYDEDAARLVALLGDELLGSAPAVRGARTPKDRSERGSARPVELSVEVVWGDVTRVESDVYCVGHYQGVLPQRAELALDRVVSFDRRTRAAAGRSRAADDARFVLRSLTQRGVLRGELGQITLFPWAGERDRHKSVAVAGMGYPGAFNLQALRRLAESLAWTVGKLPGKKTISTVLIGSGEGGLSVEDAVRGLMQGLADAIRAGLEGSIPLLRIVEMDHSRARRIREALKSIGEEGLRLRVRSRSAEGGRIADEEALAYVLAAVASVPARMKGKDPLAPLWRKIAPEEQRRSRAREAVAGLAQRKRSVEHLAEALRITIDREPEDSPRAIPARISVVRQGRGVRVAAINDTAVVPERTLGGDFALVEELCERATDPPLDDLPALAASLRRRLVPPDFHEHVCLPSPKIFEVDRDTAIVPWELIPLSDQERQGDFLGLRYPVARQLRTGYSSPPEPAAADGGKLSALVVGDPGDPQTGDDLPGAREEAERVVRLLRERGVDVHSRLGAPKRRVPWGREGGPATRLEVLHLLDRQAFDILHYSGHGDFDPQDPSSTGWVFADGLLTAADFESAGRVPRLVVANACLSSRTSRMLQGKVPRDAAGSDAGLLPSLADEFLRRGVRNYVGTAWEVSDEGAIVFAEQLYRTLLPTAGNARGGTLGEAMLEARTAVAKHADAYGALWLAYQHYGDPDFRLRLRADLV